MSLATQLSVTIKDGLSQEVLQQWVCTSLCDEDLQALDELIFNQPLYRVTGDYLSGHETMTVTGTLQGKSVDKVFHRGDTAATKDYAIALSALS